MRARLRSLGDLAPARSRDLAIYSHTPTVLRRGDIFTDGARFTETPQKPPLCQERTVVERGALNFRELVQQPLHRQLRFVLALGIEDDAPLVHHYEAVA